MISSYYCLTPSIMISCSDSNSLNLVSSL